MMFMEFVVRPLLYIQPPIGSQPISHLMEAVLFQFSRYPQFRTATTEAVIKLIVSVIYRQLFVNCSTKLLILFQFFSFYLQRICSSSSHLEYPLQNLTLKLCVVVQMYYTTS